MRTLKLFEDKYSNNENISIVTCYDYSFARILNNSLIDCLLVGDSLGMVIQGNDSTLPVEVDDIIYHSRAVRRGAPEKIIIGDMPFLSCSSVEKAVLNAGKIITKGKCDAVKVEGSDDHTLQVIKRLIESGIPVMGHIGLTPQNVHTLGGHKVQGKTPEKAKQLINAAKSLEEIGIFSLLIEMIPEDLAQKITKTAGVPTIGIGAGRFTSGQVLVIYDLLGLNPDFNPRYLKKYTNLYDEIINALNNFDKEVKGNIFPKETNAFGNTLNS